MGTNTNNETYEANQREANNSTISGFDMRDKVDTYRLYAANENGNIRDTYTGKKCYEELSNT